MRETTAKQEKKGETFPLSFGPLRFLETGTDGKGKENFVLLLLSAAAAVV